MQTLLILTNSFDLTTDLLLDRLQDQPVFRFNFDQFAQYSFHLDPEGFRLADPSGRSITSESVGKAYWRKPFHASADEKYAREPFFDAEARYVLSEIVNLLWMAEQLVLVEPYAERRSGKLIQLQCAARYFALPWYEVAFGLVPRHSQGVVKSLSNALVDGKVFYTSRVATDSLSRKHPWFIESEIIAHKDVTVVFIRGRLFSYALERSFLEHSVDWREFISPEQNWAVIELPVTLKDGICQFMKRMKLDYGRLDFLLDKEGQYWFCEVNPNGQFAWLDLEDRAGLLSAIAAEISPSTLTHPLSNRHPVPVFHGQEVRP